MIVFHRTHRDAAIAILREGFKDATGSYFTDHTFSGVWVSNVPLDENEGAKGDMLFSISIPAKAIRKYEWIEEVKPYREFLVPASVLNSQADKLVLTAPPLGRRAHW